MNTIYTPSGRAKEYGDYALNIFMGCPHGCKYCFAPNVLKKDKQTFHGNIEPRAKIVEETRKFLDKHTEIKGKHIHLCFTCDPFPNGYEQYHHITNEIIKIIHESGNNVQILTKSRISNDTIDLLVKNDIVGISISCSDWVAKTVEPFAEKPTDRLQMLKEVKDKVGCKTFISCEPVLEEFVVYGLIENFEYADEFKIGKLNYHKLSEWGLDDINWGAFGKESERLCKLYNRNYYIKDGLREEMEKQYLKN